MAPDKPVSRLLLLQPTGKNLSADSDQQTRAHRLAHYRGHLHHDAPSRISLKPQQPYWGSSTGSMPAAIETYALDYVPMPADVETVICNLGQTSRMLTENPWPTSKHLLVARDCHPTNRLFQQNEQMHHADCSPPRPTKLLQGDPAETTGACSGSAHRFSGRFDLCQRRASGCTMTLSL